MTFLKLLDGSGKDDNGVVDDDEGGDERAVTAMSILSTIETVLDMMEEEREITLQLESIVAPVVAHVLKNRLIGGCRKHGGHPFTPPSSLMNHYLKWV